MHRRTCKLRTIIAALALLLQLAGPGWMLSVAVAGGSAHDLTICSTRDQPTDQRTPVDPHGIVCPLCVLCGHAFYAAPATPPTVEMPALTVLVAHHRLVAASPRGPPAHTPNARAPPSELV